MDERLKISLDSSWLAEFSEHIAISFQLQTLDANKNLNDIVSYPLIWNKEYELVAILSFLRNHQLLLRKELACQHLFLCWRASCPSGTALGAFYFHNYNNISPSIVTNWHYHKIDTVLLKWRKCTPLVSVTCQFFHLISWKWRKDNWLVLLQNPWWGAV